MRLFADDCVVYRKIESAEDSTILQHDLGTLFTWQITWQMCFNVDKCFAVNFTQARKPETITYKLGHSTLAEVKSHTYLGVHLSNDLKWVNHIAHVTSKAKQVLGMVRRNLHPCPTKLKSTAYKTLIRPHLEFSATVWDPYTKEDIKKVESVQRKAARFVCRDYGRRSSVTDMIERLEWEPLQTRRKISRMTMLYKTQNGQVAIPAQKFLQPVTRPTRHHNSKAFQRYHTKKDCYKNTFFLRSIADWNILPENLINITNTETFKEALSTHYKQERKSN
ncbi:uncharacterized protein [Amphiura filiformis]|uniref:uncharacterized protein n=1 Tax=Amphiura filiformis TaxID=82378 RepID=UPI003B21E804